MIILSSQLERFLKKLKKVDKDNIFDIEIERIGTFLKNMYGKEYKMVDVTVLKIINTDLKGRRLREEVVDK
jgi:hypothetical protein